MRTDTPTIQKLSSSVVNKIAAGEVIERPASVLKELLENAVDAGSTQIDVALRKGGCELIRVADNGCGISAPQLPLAVACHATSKIRTADDLFQVGTLGFRGEALASIAEISQLSLRSRVNGDTAGHEMNVHGGHLEEVAPCGCPEGTTVEVRNLFFNTPVRRKFMRTTQTELGHSTEAFIRIALAYPEIQFSLQHNDRYLFELAAVDDWQERIAAIFGPELSDSLLAVESDDGSIKLTGFVANPAAKP